MLSGPDPELTFDLTLDSLLTSQTRVLEASCGHGPDAARFGPRAPCCVAYDRQPELIQLAIDHAPEAEFHL